MKVFSAESANDAWKLAAREVLREDCGQTVGSRLGQTRECLHAILRIGNPRDRWVVSRLPAMNPAFALAEVIWVMAGRDDVGFLAHWFPKYPEFVGGGQRQHGAYGKRLRRSFGFDQIHQAYRALSGNRSSRQVVLQTWSPADDFPDDGGQPRAADIPCNMTSCLKVRDGKLEWLQLSRSNDVDRGLPYNLVLFTMLQEMMAGWLGLDVGEYVHVADSLHWYLEGSSRLRMSDAVVAAENRDRFDHEFDTSTRAVELIASRMDDIISARRNGHRPPTDAFEGELPNVFGNIYSIIAADDARRHGEHEAAAAFVSRCGNPIYSQLWRRWTDRTDRALNTGTSASVT